MNKRRVNNKDILFMVKCMKRPEFKPLRSDYDKITEAFREREMNDDL